MSDEFTKKFKKSHVILGFKKRFFFNLFNFFSAENTSQRLDYPTKNVHEGEKKGLKCRSCDKFFDKIAKLRQHVRRVHEKIKKIPCKTCEKKFDSPSDLKRHTRNDHHEILNNLHKCEQCEKSFGISKNLERHILAVHADKKDFECKFCEKSFERKISLIQHTKTHTKWNQKRKMSKMNNSSIKKKIQKNLK